MNVVITGANRGIGLGLTKKFLSTGNNVWACCRNPDGARELWELERDYHDKLKLIQLDVTDSNEVAALAEKLKGVDLDLLINNAGVIAEGPKDLAGLTADSLVKSFNVNTIGPTMVCQALLPVLQKSTAPKVANITSKMGSVADNTSGSYYAYRMSKAALNMFNKSFSVDFPKITSVVLHPGWVKTDMGGSSAPTEVEASVNGLYQVITGLKKEQSGRFYDMNGKEIPW